MKLISGIKILMALSAFVLLINSCDFFDEETKVYKEESKSIVGSWKIIKASRNEIDITSMMDFDNFRVNFYDDGTYSIDNYLPFVVSKNGKYNLDDPEYPFHIQFMQDGDSQQTETSLVFPIVNAERQIGLTFSPGCKSNTYTYILQRETNN